MSTERDITKPRTTQAQEQTLKELASVLRGARAEGWTSTPILTSQVYIDALDAGSAALRAPSPVGEQLKEDAFIVEESIRIIESSLDGEYVVGYNGLTNALNDLRRLAGRLVALSTTQET